MANETNSNIGDYYNKTTTSNSMSTLVSIEQYTSIYGPLVLTTLGIIGNILSILIFLSPRYRRQSSHFYLLSLALSDLCFLLIYLIEDTFRNHNQLYQSRLNILDHSSTMVCIFFQYARNITRFLSSWIIVSFTIERLLVVFYPLKRAVICRRKIARCIVMILFIMGILVNINVPFHYGIVNVTNDIGQPDTICDIRVQYRAIYMRFAISTMLIVYLMPMCIIGIVNMLICCKLWSKSLLTEKDEKPKSSQRKQRSMHSRRSFYLSDLLSCLHSSSSSSNSLKDTEEHKSQQESSTSQHPSFRPLIPIEIHISETNDFRVPDETKSQSMVRSYSNQQLTCPTIKKQSSVNVKNYIQSRTNRVTLTLLLVSCSFLLLNSPYCAVYFVNYVQSFRNTALNSIKEITELFMLMNFCINFLLYCVSGKVFRDELMCILRCQWKQLYNKKEGKKQVRPIINLQLQGANRRSAKK
ncbi:unnamed protein product [Adineta steineri]|uniref:G-protein coupled receptors family 1 profile domain-containing protein n=1 Tax=Adineta steineri TaxID=433720 RepID=A0A818QZN8_9BILA|nr:unnamed protein product [Adineta steineri]CAF3646180.1 unnamed protein product [Adineta steineri]